MRKKGHGAKHTRPKKWSGAHRPAGPATTALTNHAPGEPLVGPFLSPGALFGANLNMVHWVVSGI